jgi:DNA-3-methyladenine glycosylase I
MAESSPAAEPVVVPAAAPAAAPPVSPWATRTVTVGADGVVRCAWGVEADPLYRAYHDEEWGRPSRDERHLFEMLVLEGAQAGLSWSTILRKREGYRRAFAGFDPALVAGFGDADVARLLADAGIVRNRLKVASAVANARAVLALRDGGPSLVDLLWAFVGDAPPDRRIANLGELPAQTAESRAMSRELKRRGFRFVGPTICYAFMQAAGLVNDHVVGCAAGDEIRSAGA